MCECTRIDPDVDVTSVSRTVLYMDQIRAVELGQRKTSMQARYGSDLTPAEFPGLMSEVIDGDTSL